MQFADAPRPSDDAVQLQLLSSECLTPRGGEREKTPAQRIETARQQPTVALFDVSLKVTECIEQNQAAAVTPATSSRGPRTHEREEKPKEPNNHSPGAKSPSNDELSFLHLDK